MILSPDSPGKASDRNGKDSCSAYCKKEAAKIGKFVDAFLQRRDRRASSQAQRYSGGSKISSGSTTSSASCC